MEIPFYKKLLTCYYTTMFDVIVSLKWTNRFKWNVDVREVTFEGLKKYIRKEYELPSLKKDEAVLNFISKDKKRHSSSNN